jgi:hypothetical protein
MMAAPEAERVAGQGAVDTPRAPVLAMVLMLALVVALQFGPLIGLLGFLVTDDPVWALGGAARDALVLALLALALAARIGAAPPPLPASARWAVALVLVVALLAALSDSGLFVVALNLRRLALVPLLYLAVLAVPWTAAQVDRLFSVIVVSSAVVAAFGVVERLAPETFWTEWLQIEAYNAANGFDKFGTQPYAQSGRFFSSDLLAWTGEPVRRLVSSYLEPTTLGAAMAALLALALARRARGHRAGGLVLLAVVAGVATLSKGFWLFLVMLLLWRGVGVPSPRHLLAMAGVGCVLAWLAAAALQLEGPLVHVGGLTTALQHLVGGNWLGEGLGGAGNYTNDAIEVGDESGLGNAIGQVGLAAVLPLLWVAAIARDVLAVGVQRRDPGAPWLAAWLMFWMLTFLFSASSLGVGGNALGFVALALYLHPASAPLRLSPARRRVVA